MGLWFQIGYVILVSEGRTDEGIRIMKRQQTMNTTDRIVRLKEIWETEDSSEFTIEETILMAELCIEWELDWRTDSSEESDACKMFNAIQNHNSRKNLNWF